VPVAEAGLAFQLWWDKQTYTVFAAVAAVMTCQLQKALLPWLLQEQKDCTKWPQRLVELVLLRRLAELRIAVVVDVAVPVAAAAACWWSNAFVPVNADDAVDNECYVVAAVP